MKSNTSTVVNLTTSGYQAKVINEAVKRAGHCKNLKGHILEVCYKDKINFSVANIIRHRHAQLTKSAIATRDDLVVIQAGKVVKRFQCKDTPSISGTMDTVKRISEGQYSRTNMVGTTESAKSINHVLDKNKVKSKIRVKDSKISSKTTELMALQANGANPLKHMDLIAYQAGKVAKSGAVVGGGISVIENGHKVIKGKMDLDEATVKVAADAGKSALSAGIGGSVDVFVTMMIAMTPAALISKPLGTASGIITGVAVDKAINGLCSMVNKSIDKRIEHKIRNSNDGYGYLKRMGII